MLDILLMICIVALLVTNVLQYMETQKLKQKLNEAKDVNRYASGTCH